MSETLAPRHKDLRFLDESGVNLGLTRLFGRATPGERVVEGTPDDSGPHSTVIASLGWDGVQAPWLLEGAMTGIASETYVEHILAPTLRPKEIVLMDNLPAHEGSKVRALIEARGTTGILAALLVRLEPDRRVLFEGQDGPARGQGAHLR
jgi:DDE superfamily endonuclease